MLCALSLQNIDVVAVWHVLLLFLYFFLLLVLRFSRVVCWARTCLYAKFIIFRQALAGLPWSPPVLFLKFAIIPNLLFNYYSNLNTDTETTILYYYTFPLLPLEILATYKTPDYLTSWRYRLGQGGVPVSSSGSTCTGNSYLHWLCQCQISQK